MAQQSAAIMGANQLTAKLPNCASIFTAEIHAILLAFRLIAKSSNASIRLGHALFVLNSNLLAGIKYPSASRILLERSYEGTNLASCQVRAKPG